MRYLKGGINTLVGINFGEKNDKPNENIKNLSTKNDLSDLLLKMGFKKNKDGIIMLLDDEKAKKSFLISKKLNKTDEEDEEPVYLYLRASVLVQALMYNIVYKYSKQLKRDEKFRKYLKENFDLLIKKINDLYDNMHAQDGDDQNVYGEEIDKAIDAYNALSADSDKTLTYLIRGCTLDIFQRVEFDCVRAELESSYVNLKQYLDNVWQNLENAKLGYLLIDNEANPSEDLYNIQHVSWDKSKLSFVLNTYSGASSEHLFEPCSVTQDYKYDNFIFGESDHFCLGMGYQCKKHLKETRGNFYGVLNLCNYYRENYYNAYDEEKFDKSEIKKCLYDRKQAYLSNLLELITKENKYSKEQIIKGIDQFRNAIQDSGECYAAIKLAFEYRHMNDNTMMIINSPVGYNSDGYTYDFVLKNLDDFMVKHDNDENGDLEFKNEEAKNEFKNLNIEPGTQRTVLFSNAEFKSPESREKYLSQFLSFVPTKELLKTKSSEDKIYLMDFDRLNDIKDSDKLKLNGDKEHDYEDIVKKIVKEACRKGKSSEFKDIFEHMKSMFMNDKIVLRDDNKGVMQYFFKFFVKDQREYQFLISEFELSGYEPCVSCLEFMPELYEKYKDSKQSDCISDCINSIAGDIFEFTLEKLGQSHIDMGQFIQAMIQYKEKFGISVDNMAKIKSWMNERLYTFSENSFTLYLGKSINQLTSLEWMKTLFEFKNYQQIVDTNRSYFLKHAGNAIAELNKSKKENEELLGKIKSISWLSAAGNAIAKLNNKNQEGNKELITKIKSIQWLPNNDKMTDEEFRKCIQCVLSEIDKNDANVIGPLFIKSCFGTKKTAVKTYECVDGFRRAIIAKKDKLKYSDEKIKIFTEETVKKFVGFSEINKLICDNMFKLLNLKLLNDICLDSVILNSDKTEHIIEYINRFIGSPAGKIKINFGPKAFAHIVSIISKEKLPEVREKAIQSIFNNKFIYCNDSICDNIFHNDIMDKDEMPEQDDQYRETMQKAVLTYLENHEDTRRTCAEHVLCDFLKTQTKISLDFIKQICPLRTGDAYYSFKFISTVIDKLSDEIDFDCLKLLLFGDKKWGAFISSYRDNTEIYKQSFENMVIKVADWCFFNKVSKDEICKLFEAFAGQLEKINKIITDREKQISESKINEDVAIKNSESKATKLNEKESNLNNKDENSNNDINEKDKKGSKPNDLNTGDNIDKVQVPTDVKNENDNFANSENVAKETNINNQIKERNSNMSSLQDKQVNNVADNKFKPKSTNELKLNTAEKEEKKKEKEKEKKEEIENKKEMDKNIGKKTNVANKLANQCFSLDNQKIYTEGNMGEKNNDSNEKSRVLFSKQKGNTGLSSKREENINNNYERTIKLGTNVDVTNDSNLGNENSLVYGKEQVQNKNNREKHLKFKVKNDNKINNPTQKEIQTSYDNLNNQPEISNKTGEENQNTNPKNSDQNNFFTWDTNFCIGVILGLSALAFIKFWILFFIILPFGYMIYKGCKCKQFNNQKELAKYNSQVVNPGEQKNESVDQNLSEPVQIGNRDGKEKDNNNENDPLIE